MNDNIVSVIDFSSSGIRLVTGYHFKGTVYILNALEGDSIPLDENGYLDKKSAEESLTTLIYKAKETLKNNLGVFIALLPPDGFTVESIDEKSTTVDPSSKIIQRDYNNCINQINKQVKSKGKSIVYHDPISFADDNRQSYDTFPMGSSSKELQVFADVHLIDDKSFNHYKSILDDCKIPIYMTLVAPFATVSFISSLNIPKKFLCLDIGKDYSYFSYIFKRRLNVSTKFPFGINAAVKKASEMLNLSFDKTLEYLQYFGFHREEEIAFISEEDKPLDEIVSAFEKSFEPLVDLIKMSINKYQVDDDTLLVITGTGADIVEFDNYLVHQLKRDNKVFIPKVIGAKDKVFTNCIGAILISALPYQNPITEAIKMGGYHDFQNESFSRGK